MRWWKQFREDFDRPAFQLGIERFGTSFVHDLGRVWQLLCVEDGPGIREIELTDNMLRVLARQFRVTTNKAMERIDFMATVGLIDLAKGTKPKFSTLFSSELKKRRDEWSARKDQKASGMVECNAPERLPSDSGVAREQLPNRGRGRGRGREQISNAKKALTAGESLTGNLPCTLKEKNPWAFCGLIFERIPRKFRTAALDGYFHDLFAEYAKKAHENGVCRCSAVEFLGYARSGFKEIDISYPPAFLARQRELENRKRLST